MCSGNAPRTTPAPRRRPPTRGLLALAAGVLVLGAGSGAVGCAARTAHPEKESPAEPWIEDLASPTQGVRTRATIALSRLDPVEPRLVAALSELLRHKRPAVRAQALLVLGNLGSAAVSALPEIFAALEDEDENVRRAAAGALSRVPAHTREARLALVSALASEDRRLRSQAGVALAAVAEDAADVAPELGRLARHEDEKIRYAALHVLEKLDAEAVVPVLLALLAHEEGDVRRAAARSLGSFGARAEAAVPALIERLGDARDRPLALRTLERLGPAAEPVVPALLAILHAPAANDELRTDATRALGAVGPAAAQALPKLRAELTRADLSEARSSYRRALAAAIRAIAGPDDPALASYATRLSRAQSSWNPNTRVEAVRALIALGPAASPALGALRESLREDREPKVRGLAAEALGAIGAAARSALPDLRAAQAEPDDRVRAKAKRAIEKIEQSAPAPVAKPAPAPDRPELSRSISDDIAALSRSGSRATRAAVRLLERGQRSLPAMHAALASPVLDERQRRELVALLGELGDASSVDVLLRAVSAHPDDPGLRVAVLRALAQMAQTPASFAFATGVLEDSREPLRAKRQALLTLASQRDLRARKWADLFRNARNVELRAAALYAAASFGDRSAVDPIAALLRGRARSSFRYTLLVALAELVDPIQFETLAAPARLHPREYESGLRIAKLRGASAGERSALAREMLRSRFPTERRIALRDLLEREALDELAPLLEQWWKVPSPVRITVAGGLHRAGYRLVEKERRLLIERVRG